jgi:multidrug efflux pump subunit AcrB
MLTVNYLFNSLRITLIIWLTVPLYIIGIVIGMLVFQPAVRFDGLARRAQPLGRANQK